MSLYKRYNGTILFLNNEWSLLQLLYIMYKIYKFNRLINENIL